MSALTTDKKRLNRTKCPVCGRITLYSLKGPKRFKTAIQCKKCGMSISIRDARIDLWEDDVLERARRTRDQCKRLIEDLWEDDVLERARRTRDQCKRLIED